LNLGIHGIATDDDLRSQGELAQRQRAGKVDAEAVKESNNASSRATIIPGAT
jgi:hypothetical protein